jgi:hypothetical protein
MGALLHVVIRSGCPLFDRPKRGRKKPHQPALAHCVRVAGLDALRLTVLLRAGAANRKGPRGHPVDSLGHLPSLRHRFAKSPSAAQNRPRRRTAKGPGNESAGEGEEGRPAVRLSFCSTSKRASIGRRFLPATGSGVGGSGCSFAASAGGLCTRDAFTHPRPDHRSLSCPLGASKASRQEPLRFIRRAPCGDGASQRDRAVDGRTNAALQPIFAADGENIPDDGLIPAQYGQIILADEVQMPYDEQIFSSVAGEGQIGAEIEKKILVAHGKIPVGQAKKTDGRHPILVSDSRRLGREENRLVGRKNEPVRWGSASPVRSSGGEQKRGGRHQRRSPCFRGVVERMRERTAGRWGQVGEGGLGIRGSAPSVGPPRA